MFQQILPRCELVESKTTFLPLDFYANAAEASTTASTSQSTSLEQVSQRQQNKTYIDLFWMDLCERNSDILLFDKVALPDTSPNRVYFFVTSNVQ